jgi:hypothetical protein
VLGQHYQDLKADSDQKAVFQKLPEAGLFIAPIALGPLAITGSGSYADFQREEGIDGRRLGASLKTAYTIGRGPTLTQTIEARKNFYRLNDIDEDENIIDTNAAESLEDAYDNTFVDYTAALQARISRGFGGIHHDVVPSISYSYFTSTGDDLPGRVFFDSTESFVEISQVELSLMNRVMDNKGEFFTFRATQQYDFMKENEDGRPFLPLVLNLALARPVSLTVGMTYDTYERHITALNSRANFSLPRTTVSVGHTYQRTADDLPEIKIYDLDTQVRVTGAVTVGASATYDAEHSGPRELTADIKYLRQCWGLSIEYAEREVLVDEEEQKEHWAFFKIRLLGVSSFGFSVREAQSWSLGD